MLLFFCKIKNYFDFFFKHTIILSNISKIKNMKKILLFLSILILSVFSFEATFSFDLFDRDKNKTIYCQWNDCSLERWIEIVKEDLSGIEKNQKASVFIQNIVVYLMTFITLIAVIYIIYAWFRILVGAWDEEQQTNAKKIIISVVAWIALMWLSFAIVDFILDILDSGSETPPTP